MRNIVIIINITVMNDAQHHKRFWSKKCIFLKYAVTFTINTYMLANRHNYYIYHGAQYVIINLKQVMHNIKTI